MHVISHLVRKGLLHKSALVKVTARTVPRRTTEEGLAKCESAMASEKDTAERVAETDKTVRRSESRIRSKAKRTL